MEGTPLRTSAVNRTTFPYTFRPYSARKIPVPMPNGIPMMLAMRRMNPEPTSALAMPPPGSPGGFGIWVKKAQFSPAIPRYTTVPNTRNNGTVTIRAARVIPPSAIQLLSLRRQLIAGCKGLGKGPRRLSARYAPYQKTRQSIHNQSYDKQNQGNFNQRTQVEIVSGFRKLIGNHAGQRVPGSKQGFRYFRPVANDHGHCHGFADGASKAENDGAQDSHPRIAQHSHAQDFPLGSAQRQHSLALITGHGHNDLASD